MAWIVAAAFAIITVITFSLYWRGVRESNHLTNFILLVLIEDSVYQAQRNGLRAFLTTTAAKDARELAFKAMRSTTDLANQLAPKTMLGVTGMLWKARQDGRTDAPA